MKALVAALNRVAAALEQLVPALTQATREAHARVVSIPESGRLAMMLPPLTDDEMETFANSVRDRWPDLDIAFFSGDVEFVAVERS